MPEPWGLGAELRDELLNCEIFYTLKEAQVLVEQWRIYYNTVRPHSSLGYPSSFSQ
jgi:transposase InsO family protein